MSDLERDRRIGVLLVEDHRVVREGLRYLLEREEDIEVIGEADTGELACKLAKELKPDVILMDIGLPGMDGIQATKHIKDQLPSVRILALTMYRDEEHIYAMLRAGAEGYLLKHTAASDLTSALRAIYAGESTLSPNVAKKLIDGIKGHRAYRHPDDVLSEREKEVLLLMAHGKTSRDIAAELYLSPKTVDNHRAHIIEKLQAKNRVEAVMNAVKLGIISPTQAERAA